MYSWIFTLRVVVHLLSVQFSSETSLALVEVAPETGEEPTPGNGKGLAALRAVGC